MFERSVIEISKDRIRNNLLFIRSIISDSTELCAVVKGNAYGHSLSVYAPYLQAEGVRCFAISSAQEAYELRPHLSDASRIVVLSEPPARALEWLIFNRVEFYLGSLEFVSSITRSAAKAGTPAKIHLELETGMYRTGVCADELDAVLEQIESNRSLIDVVGICTHLAGPECRENEPRVRRQIENFEQLSSKIQMRLGRTIARHAACSAAAIAYPESRFDMVRVGVLQYGFWPTLEIKERYYAAHPVPELVPRQVLSWKTHIHSTQNVPKGSYVGYGKSFKAERSMQIAMLPIGYADGFSRALSNKGYVLVKGKRAPVVGTVNMNMLTIDVTDIKDAHVGDEVVVLGDQDGERIVVSSFSDLLNTLNYESLVRLADHIERRIVEH